MHNPPVISFPQGVPGGSLGWSSRAQGADVGEMLELLWPGVPCNRV